MASPSKDLSYFVLRLKNYLNNSFPEFSSDNTFISRRAKLAENAYEGAFSSGNSTEQCNAIADFILFEGLLFSRFDTLFNVVCREFYSLMADEDLRPFALKMMGVCDPVFSKYNINDDFGESPEFELLYTELTGTLQLWIEAHGLQ